MTEEDKTTAFSKIQYKITLRSEQGGLCKVIGLFKAKASALCWIICEGCTEVSGLFDQSMFEDKVVTSVVLFVAKETSTNVDI